MAVVWVLLSLLFLATPSVSFEGRNPEVETLIKLKNGLIDPRGVLSNWDEDSVDPCSWAMITCSPDNLVTGLGAPSQGLSGILSGMIANLTNLRQVLLQNNNISGEIPSEIGALPNLETLDLSSNQFSGHMPESLGLLHDLQYLRLNNNSLCGAIPLSLAKVPQLAFLDLSYNNLSGPVPKFRARTFNILGNSLICGSHSTEGCSGSAFPIPLSFSLSSSSGKHSSKKLATALGVSLSLAFLIFIAVVFIYGRRYRSKKHTILNITDLQEEGLMSLGNLRNFTFRELQVATDYFSSKNILGSGGFGNVYKGKLADGTMVAVKRLKDVIGTAGEAQFRTELEMISLAVHRNLLRLIGYCATPNERLLVYPFMSNGSVASRLREKPALDWNTRKRIAIGAARAVRGTVGHIAPEYLSTGQSSEKTDVFGFGILLLELITGTRALEFGKTVNQKGAMLDWVRKVQQEKKLELLVDRELGSNYDQIDVGEMLQVALLCTQYLPAHRPKMSDLVRMLEGDGLAEKWAASHHLATNPTTNFFLSNKHSKAQFYLNPAARHDDENDYDSSSVFGMMMDDEHDSHAMELSGPR
ncbi:hypothetical protein Vadar_005971 [Vaccinium darrowii]|uniref:Uncharacterized protein n=1 Tax=Vaccinium darrowii TaxID=229202 RepID=A0ACB7YKP0_9ERIC|nr:hypothetical protein Vadar_005971 [Vaccinium darrowii]